MGDLRAIVRQSDGDQEERDQRLSEAFDILLSPARVGKRSRRSVGKSGRDGGSKALQSAEKGKRRRSPRAH